MAEAKVEAWIAVATAEKAQAIVDALEELGLVNYSLTRGQPERPYSLSRRRHTTITLPYVIAYEVIGTILEGSVDE